MDVVLVDFDCAGGVREEVGVDLEAEFGGEG